MFARTGSTHFNRHLDETGIDMMGLLRLDFVFGVIEQDKVKVPVAYVTHERGLNICCRNDVQNRADTGRQF